MTAMNIDRREFFRGICRWTAGAGFLAIGISLSKRNGQVEDFKQIQRCYACYKLPQCQFGNAAKARELYDWKFV